MHSIKVSLRLVAFFVVAIAAVLAFASLSPGSPERASANADAQEFTFFLGSSADASALDVQFKKSAGAAAIASVVVTQEPAGCGAATVVIKGNSEGFTLDWVAKCVTKLESVTVEVTTTNKVEIFVSSVEWQNPITVAIPDTANTTASVTCTDIWFDLAPFGNTVPDPATDLLVGKSLTRTEPSQDPNKANGVDLVTVTYLGADKKDGADPTSFSDFPADTQSALNLAITVGIIKDEAAALDLVADIGPSPNTCQQKADEAHGTPAAQLYKATVAHVDTYDRIVIDVGTTANLPINAIVTSASFTCLNGAGEVVVGVLKNIEKNQNPDDPNDLFNHEVWSANFATKCIDKANGVNITLQSGATDLLIKECRVENTSTPGAVTLCNLNPSTAQPPNTVIKATIKQPQYSRIDIVIDNADAEKKLKSVTFRCQSTKDGGGPGQWVIGKNKTTELPGFEIWSADFSEKCIIADTAGVDIQIKKDPAAANSPDIVGGSCQVSNPKSKQKVFAPCTVTSTGTQQGEKNRLDNQIKYAQVSNHRPGTTTTPIKVGGQSTLQYATCLFSEQFGLWIRTDVDTLTKNSGPGSKNTGTSTLWFGASVKNVPEENMIDDDGDNRPDRVDPAGLCDVTFAVPFHAILATLTRDVTTDHPLEASGKNALYGIPIDPDGAVANACAAHTTGTPKVPGGVECADADLLADDWDGDGCSDWDELDKNFINGRDPFNPKDCDNNYTGVYNILVTVAAATTCTGSPLFPIIPCLGQNTGFGIPGTYFNCIARLDHDKGDDSLLGSAQCYQDSPGLSAGGGAGGTPTSGVPSRADGLAGAPPPPPYGVSKPTKLFGTFNAGTKTLELHGCFENFGGSVGPNVVVELSVDGASMKGDVTINQNQSIVQCDAAQLTGAFTATPQPGQTTSTSPVSLAAQAANMDHDLDGCTDRNELSLNRSNLACGDDPYNPWDSDLSIDSVGNLLVTAARADWNPAEPNPALAFLPGSYFHCITDTQHNKSTNELDLSVFCYIDIATVNVNNTAYAGVKGDGLPGAGPPFGFTNNPLVNATAFGDVDDNHTNLTGTLNKKTNAIEIAGCFNDKDGTGSLGHVYTAATIDVHTGQGKVDIWLNVADVNNCLTGTGLGAASIVGALIETVEQEPKVTPNGVQNAWDTDLDGCSDKQELSNTQLTGGLRDPYNRWDLFDAEQTFSEKSVGFLDFLAILQRFNTVDNGGTAVINRTSDPQTTPDAGAGVYHPRFDRNISFIAGSNFWNEGPPDGAIGFLDFNAILRQFNTSCA